MSNKIRVYDNNGKTWDRFTFIIEHENGNQDWYGSSNNPFSPQGYGQYVGDGEHGNKEGKHLGKRIAIKDLPEDVQKFIQQVS